MKIIVLKFGGTSVGTTDRIKKIVDTYLNKGNVRYFHRENITGLASAHNFCIDHMNGDWLKIMSSDDILLPDAIENFVKYAHSKKSKILYPDVQYINEIGNSIGTRIQQEFDNPEKLEEYLWLYQIIISVSLFYHKSCFDTVGKFDETLIETFDYKWISQATVLHNCRFTHIPKILFKFRLHKKQTSFEHSKQHLSDVSKIRHSILNELLKKNPEKWNLFQKRISKYDEIQSNDNNLEKPTESLEIDSSKNEFKCKICEHFGDVTNLIYIFPTQDSVSCGQCHTIFSRKELEESTINDKN